MINYQRIKESLKIATDTKIFELGSNILHNIPNIFTEEFQNFPAIIIADNNTWKAAGEKIYNYLIAANVKCDKYIFPENEFHAEWEYVERIDDLLSKTKAIAIAVGSGVINDICKLSSFHHSQSYICVPTAASVDGFSSFGASIVYKNAKQTFECPAPKVICADIDIIAAAPKCLNAAGYADLAAKIPAGAEWMIADIFGTEPIIPSAWHVLQDVIDEMLADPMGVANGDKKAIALLFEGLTLSGFAMQAAGSSRPASCSDHLFSHILDMTHHRYKGELQSHGFQVAIGTLTMCAFFDEFFKLDLSTLDIDTCVSEWPSLGEEQERALEIFKNFPAPKLGYTEITKKYADKEEVRKQLSKVKENWFDFKAKLQNQCYTFEKMQTLFKSVGAPSDPKDIGISREQLKNMLPLVQLMRYRINLLDLAKRAGIYDTLVDRVFGKGGAWEIQNEENR